MRKFRLHSVAVIASGAIALSVAALAPAAAKTGDVILQ